MSNSVGFFVYLWTK